MNTKKFKLLVGKTVKRAWHVPEYEGIYRLEFTDGTAVEFSATGDDATYVTFEMTKGGSNLN